MSIIVKNKDTLIYDDFVFRCCVGKNGFTKNKVEGDKKTPRGNFKIDCLYFRKDRKEKPQTNLKTIQIKKNMGWCDDVNSRNYYNKLIKIPQNLNHEKLFRYDYIYDFFLPIKYNWKNTILGVGSAIFIHLTKSYKPTAGCIGLTEKDFLILIKLIKKDTIVKIL
tara:strand:+ start:192 stop:686 length:495 start_codon:yes stop_codon:yes gene_type:complete